MSTCKFTDQLTSDTSPDRDDQQPTHDHGHGHDHSLLGHSHGDGSGAWTPLEHGHTHEHLEHAGTSSGGTAWRDLNKCIERRQVRRKGPGQSGSPSDLMKSSTDACPIWPLKPDYSSRNWTERAFTIGIGGLGRLIASSVIACSDHHRFSPVGSGKTALTLALCQALRDHYNIGMITASTAVTPSVG